MGACFIVWLTSKMPVVCAKQVSLMPAQAILKGMADAAYAWESCNHSVCLFSPMPGDSFFLLQDEIDKVLLSNSCSCRTRQHFRYVSNTSKYAGRGTNCNLSHTKDRNGIVFKVALSMPGYWFLKLVHRASKNNKNRVGGRESCNHLVFFFSNARRQMLFCCKNLMQSYCQIPVSVKLGNTSGMSPTHLCWSQN